MIISTDSLSTHRRVRVQRTPDNSLLGCTIYLDAMSVAPYIFGEAEFLDVIIVPEADGIKLKIRESDA